MRLALVEDLERLAVVAAPAAALAGDEEIGQEVHLDAQHAVALAGLAAPALHVEREAPGPVAAHARLGDLAEQGPDAVEHARVGGGVAARRAADRRLIDVDHLVDVLEPADAVEAAGCVVRAVEMTRERAVERVVHERRFARAGDARHDREDAERDAQRHVLQVVLAAAGQHERLRAGRAALLRRGDRAPPGEVVARQRARRRPRSRAGVPCATICPPWMPAPGPMSSTKSAARIVSSSCSTTITQLPASRRRKQALEQALVVARVQADRGLVEDVEHAHQARAHLRREPDALALAARERGAAAIERQVVEAHLRQEGQPVADLLEHAVGDRALRPAQLERCEEARGLADREATQIRDRRAGNLHAARLGAQPRAFAVGARLLAAVARERLALELGGGLEAARELAEHAVPAAREGGLARRAARRGSRSPRPRRRAGSPRARAPGARARGSRATRRSARRASPAARA